MQIGEFGRATATKVETIRYYEQTGQLPPPPRTKANYRHYGENHLSRLSCIRRARDLGFPLSRVRALLDLSDDSGVECGTNDRIATEQRREVERTYAELSPFGSAFRKRIASCERGTGS